MEQHPLLYLGPNRLATEDIANLGRKNWRVCFAQTIGEAEKLLRDKPFVLGLVALDVSEKSSSLADLHTFLARTNLEWIGLVEPGWLASEPIMNLIRDVCSDYHTLPVDCERLIAILGHIHGMAKLRRLEQRANDHWPGALGMIGSSPNMQDLFRHIVRAARIDAPILITGESGTGKELVARALHQQSEFAGGPFVVVHCPAIPSALIQSELFGHEKGAFTGAHARRQGRIEMAQGGTFFLDEIGDLPSDLQANLLRFLQEKTIRRVGGTEEIAVRARIIAATHVDLEKATAEGGFRLDLYYRLNGFSIRVPSLRERGHDAILLAKYFLEQFRGQRQRRVRGFTRQAIEAINGYDWPGNVRELKHSIRRAVFMAEKPHIDVADLNLPRPTAQPVVMSLRAARDAAELDVIHQALESAHRNISSAADKLGITRATLYRLMEKHGLQPDSA